MKGKNQPINQSINQSISQSVSQSINQSIKHSINQPTNQSINQSIQNDHTKILKFFFQKFYLPTARQVKRIESVLRSPIYNHFSETITGVHVIRAYGCAKRFMEEMDRRVDMNVKFFFAANIASRLLYSYYARLCYSKHHVVIGHVFHSFPHRFGNLSMLSLDFYATSA